MKLKQMLAAGLLGLSALAGASPFMELVDTHIHYSHDAWERTPPPEAIRLLRLAGLQKAFVSSSSDQGTQMLYAEAPDLIVPVLRPYRKRGEISTWFRDETVIPMLEDLLEKNTYAGIGEFHIYGDDANMPVIRRVVELAQQYHCFLHLHGDAEAVENVFKQDPNATILWAHSGFEGPAVVSQMLARFPNLKADLAFRNDHAFQGKVDAQWRELFLKYPDRIMVGTDTFAPERWHYIMDHADWTREWLKDLPESVAQKIGYQNGLDLAAWALNK
ncbi:amidohydrolase family protein [Reinekea marinisedimentorum]|uniref:Uncharacterized protein n=1 Tax=Reinekea marinisedimentorum TaxID=230495 RepID=A0A4R3HYD0_9GAMM|nr:amidohydrolase family protein [Reinekea marinisedimentorum]TCS37683.1 hypothetical protein BCF53_11843 [Reinekea marinisedimentorum]